MLNKFLAQEVNAMNKVVLGGVLGAAGLVAAAIISNFNDDEVKHKFDLSKKEPSKTVDELHNQLVELDLSIVHLLQELSSIYTEFSDLVGDGNYNFEDLEDRGILGKIQDYIHEGSSIFLRQSYVSKINALKHKAIKVVTSYKDVIIKSNQYLLWQSEEPVSFEKISLRDKSLHIENSLKNESWDDSILEELERISDFLNGVGDQVELLESKLETFLTDKDKTIEAAQSNS